MYLLDTNVLSEMMKRPSLQNAAFRTWSMGQRPGELFISSFSLSELYSGIYRLPRGKKRDMLYRTVKQIEASFSTRILAFDETSAEQFGIIRERTERSGLSMDVADSYYLAAAEQHAATLVTRNTKHFVGRTELELINPWETSVL